MMRSDDNNLRMRLQEALDNLWSRIKSIFDGLDDRVSALEEGGGTRSAPTVHGASGSFTTSDGHTVTVTDGLITSITSDRR